MWYLLGLLLLVVVNFGITVKHYKNDLLVCILVVVI